MAAKNNNSDRLANPFTTLKGFVVQGGKTPEKASPQPKPKATVPSPAEEPVRFEEAMAQIGVVPLTDRPPTPEPPPIAPRIAQPSVPQTDEEQFLAALGPLDVRFSDNLPEEDEATMPQAQSRRLRQLRRGKLAPEASLDLHGLTRAEVAHRLRYFLEDCQHHRRTTVLIVTGRGNHSVGEPVLRSEVERFLQGEGRTWVAEWARAPRPYGGEGALVVFLKPPS